MDSCTVILEYTFTWENEIAQLNSLWIESVIEANNEILENACLKSLQFPESTSSLYQLRDEMQQKRRENIRWNAKFRNA